MAIVYRQISTRTEWRRGTFSLRLSVSHDYTAIFPDAEDVDVRNVSIIKVGTFKSELEDAEGKFVDDEVSIEVDSTACVTDDERDCLALMLECVDEAQERFILLEIAEGGSTTYVQAFRGVLRTDVQATDIHWYGAEYGTDPTPERAYKFAAKSYSTAVLDRDLNALIPSSPSNTSHPYWSEWATFLTDKCAHWLASGSAYNLYAFDQDYRYSAIYFSWLVDLNDALRYIADRIEDEIGDPSFTIQFATSPIGMTFGTPELEYAIAPQNALEFGDRAPLVGHRTTNSITDVTLGDDEDGPLISVRLLQPIVDNDLPYSFRRSKTLAQLCYDIARAFGMFSIFEYDNDGNLVISFRSRENVYKDGEGNVKRTYARDVTSGSLKTQPTTVTAEKERYSGFINQYAVEGVDVFSREVNTGYVRSELAKANPAGDRILALTIGATMLDTYDNSFGLIKYRKLWNTGWYYRLLADVGATDPPAALVGSGGLYSMNYIDGFPSLTTSIYVRTAQEKYYEATTTSATDTGRRYDSVRPVTQVDVEIDGVQETFTELSEYVNRLKGLDGKYFENEYEITVPYLSAFRRTSDGADSYFNLDLGSTITIDGIDYVAVGIERDFDAVTTKIRLHSLTRFSIFARPEEVAEAEIDGGAVDPSVPDERRSNVETFTAGETISAGWAVIVDDAGNAMKARPIADHYNKVVGIALDDRSAGSLVNVCTSGVCVVPDSYASGRALWLVDGNPNMSTDRISSPSSAEHVDQKIGTSVGPGVVEVNIGRPFIWFGYGGS